MFTIKVCSFCDESLKSNNNGKFCSSVCLDAYLLRHKKKISILKIYEERKQNDIKKYNRKRKTHIYDFKDILDEERMKNMIIEVEINIDRRLKNGEV